MPVINILDKAVAELIAAGEVVERPSSIVKELLENSIDAGATDISVEITGGGIRMIRVSDNGCGISREDIPKAFLRHATSKVSKAEDLDGILTLGFRGEALASIAAMCRVELVTKTAGEDEAAAYTIDGGECAGCVPAARPTGTTITVKDVFYNTPARMKFLKRDVSEGNSVAQVVDKCALSHPEIAFKLIRDGALKLKTSGNGELLAVIYAIYGREFADEMLKVDYVYENFAGVSGYISKPGCVKPSRAYQNFFINGRFVRTKTGVAALEEAYKNKIMSGKFPACFLNLELDATTVDVNVHPAKIEVRFANEKPVFSSVYYAVKSTLSKLETFSDAPLPKKFTLDYDIEKPVQQRLTALEYRESYVERQTPSAEIPAATPARTAGSGEAGRRKPMWTGMLDISVCDEIENENFKEPTGFVKIIPTESGKIFDEPAINQENNGTISVDKQEFQDFCVIGEAFGTYIIMESGDGLLLVDKHAAHERILYEKLKAGIAYGNRQTLLTPQSVALSRDEHSALTENIGELEKLGFMVEDFGGDSVIVREVPIELSNADIAFTIREIADKLKNNAKDLTPHVLDRLYYNIACRAAVKAFDKSSGDELLEIVNQLRDNPSITHCPHGRPVFVRLSRHDIEKMFGRLG